MFCPNCGNKCQDGHLFCAKCGTKLPVTRSATTTTMQQDVEQPIVSATTPSVEHRPSAVSSSQPAVGVVAPTIAARPSVTLSEEEMREGVILTHSKALASKLKTTETVIQRLLISYAQAALSRGVYYRIVDAADYMLLNPSMAGERVTLSPKDGWVEYNNLLADHYRYGRKNKEDETCYLFIVGGEDIVPMPVMRHYMASHPKLNDKDIDTDVPYAYLLGENTYALLDSGKIYEYEQYFHVGRLPLPVDASLDDLTNYMRRVSAYGDGLEIERYYGQSNMPWGEESQEVCTPLRQANIYPSSEPYTNLCAEVGDEQIRVVMGELFYSPPITENNIEQVFDTKASFYYFNLHGSNKPTDRGYYADYVGGAVMPHHIAQIEHPNFFVTEACYGAKFQRYRRNESILQSAMTGQTLAFLGSSRIAFCNNRYSIDNSDRLANVYIAELLNGTPAGDALYEARKSFFEYDDGRLYDQQLTTIAEFNLFGDPSLRVHTAGGVVRSKSGRGTLAKGGVKSVCESKCIFEAEAENRPKSLLEQVRSAVDRNLMEIRKTIDKELYERLGVEPRSLSHIFRKRFPDGKEFYSFDYAEERDNVDRLHCAIADDKGNIKTIISTK